MHTHTIKALAAALLLAFGAGAAAAPPATPAKPASGSTSAKTSFSKEQLDQMLAPVALYPDSLLAQVLMASSYPGDVSDAVAWSKAHPDAKGEDAVRQVASQAWDPSVQSLVAFPQLLAVLGQDPAWVQKMGDAFLAQPDAVMDSVQRLRRQAEAAGNLKSNEQQKVATQAGAESWTPPTIVIESAQPDVVYVPSYNPSVVYGSWAYPAYPPYYYPPPPYYYPGGALLSFGIGVAVGGALWGDLDWGHGDIDIDVNRYNEFNSNRQINRNDNKWKHNAANRDGVPYRDSATRERFAGQRDGTAQREAYRGRDDARAAERDRARQSMESRGFEPPATSNREARERAGASQREMGQRHGGADTGGFQNRGQAGAGQGRGQGSFGQGRPPGSQHDNAFSGARNPHQSLSDSNRGHRSMQSSQRPASSRPQGRPMSRPAAAPRGGGGGRRR
ncbi:DUF3300 domain-containing protein [Stenotrophomonas bentonitica]|uniref:DUF3300 domain-containing protein n=1 Tax=Stenotrophomonas bentonitica TaxID=1450134 RepID=UPI00345F002C